MKTSYHPKHECGVFGVYNHPNAAELTYYGLYALQHRGQESAGIVTAKDPGKPFAIKRGMGLVGQVFSENDLKDLVGTRAVGHVRYSTTGSSNIKNAQPLTVETSRGQIAIAHNGNLVNAGLLKQELEAAGSIFQTTTDSEIILHLISRPNPAIGGGALAQALSRVHGAYSLILMGENEVIAARDPFGFRPLVIGRLDEAIIFSSETCALDLVGAEFVREVEPGEVVVADENGLRSFKPHAETPRESLCVFEFVYFARPDSQLGGRNVSHARTRMGRELARLHPVEADIVVPVPDSGTYAALGYSEQSGIPLDQAFVRNHYIGRTFLQPTQLIRDFNVRVKLNLIRSAVQGKRVVVVDDSIVRGTTARARVTNLREAGAREVHIRVSCPPHRFSCHYGIDFPDPKDLLANRMTRQEITKYLGADSLGYLDVDGMVRACGIPAKKFCLACFTGDYPVPFAPEDNKEVLERRRDQSVSLVPEEESRQGFLL
ncbi:MAG: amidophosphoribosyltransferase [Verrucomicrobia bacterium]|nr:amidophosphoribosyltransferase [Verrucomicrobiota bacterium]NBS84032.1 amidophosphoribosyltransferase [Verrucomicrobiota bacterium]